jgi:hypothetical protein
MIEKFLEGEGSAALREGTNLFRYSRVLQKCGYLSFNIWILIVRGGEGR